MRQTPQPRFPFFALLLGLLLGVAGGVYYAWFLDPLSLTDVAPAALETEDRQAYILLISEGYALDSDLNRARLRLSVLGVRDVTELVTVWSDSLFLEAEEPDKVCAMSNLAEDLGGNPLASEVCGQVVATDEGPQIAGTITPTFVGIPTATSTGEIPTPTRTPFVPTHTPTVQVLADDAAFDLSTRFIICEDSPRAGLIQVFVYDEFGEGVPGIEILVEWLDGSDGFHTGLKPNIESGYADFRMEPGKLYTVTLVGLSESVVGIDGADCQTDSGAISSPTIQLIFEPLEAIEEETPEP